MGTPRLTTKHEMSWSWQGRLTVGDLLAIADALRGVASESPVLISTSHDQRDGSAGTIVVQIERTPRT